MRAVIYCPTKCRAFYSDVLTPLQLKEAIKRHYGLKRAPRGYTTVIPDYITVGLQVEANGSLLTGVVDPLAPTPEITLRPDSAPEPTPAKPVTTIDAAITELVEKVAARSVNEERVREIAKEEAAQSQVPREVIVKVERPDREPVKIEGAHSLLPTLLELVQHVPNVLLVGPSGSGKTELARSAAEALELPFYLTPQTLSKHDITGYRNAENSFISTPFYESYGRPAIHLFDEFDSYGPNAALAANAGLGNGLMTFGDSPEPVRRHPDSRQLAAANTYGHGADRVYVGRNQLDGATLNRFVPLEVGYCRALETRLAGEYGEWLAAVWDCRANVASLGLRYVISTRAIVFGVSLLAGGMDRAAVETMVLRQGMSGTDWERVKP